MHTANLFKILLVRDKFFTKNGFDREAYNQIAHAMQLQINANSLFKGLHDSSMKELYSNINKMTNNLNKGIKNLKQLE